MGLFFSRKKQERDSIRHGAEVQRSTIKNVLGVGQHQKNLRREFAKLNDQRRSEKRQMREQWRLQEKEYKKDLVQSKEYYDVKYHVNEYKRSGNPKFEEAQKLSAKYFGQKKKESDLRRVKEKRETERQSDYKYRDLRKEAVRGLRGRYQQQQGTAASRLRQASALRRSKL